MITAQDFIDAPDVNCYSSQEFVKWYNQAVKWDRTKRKELNPEPYWVVRC